MFSFNTKVNRIIPRLNNLVKQFSVKTKKVDGALDFTLKDNFTPEEHAKILETLNKSTPEDLSRYKISYGKIKSMSDWKKKRGPFKCLSDILEVEGLGEKKLEEICKNIAHNNVSEVKVKSKANKQAKNLLIPEMDLSLSTTLESAVTIHLDPTGIGWAKLEKAGNTVTYWNCQNFSSLPTKMLPTEIFNLAVDIVSTTPYGDVYIFEAPPHVNPQTNQGIMSTHTQQIELISMLLALLNTSVKHNQELQKRLTQQNSSQSVQNRVFYMRSKVPARLFKTLIGYEKVSAISAITGIVEQNPEALQSLPCSPVAFAADLHDNFFNQSPTKKELLAQALMLGISFMDLCIYRNANSFQALKPIRHKANEVPLK